MTSAARVSLMLCPSQKYLIKLYAVYVLITNHFVWDYLFNKYHSTMLRRSQKPNQVICC